MLTSRSMINPAKMSTAVRRLLLYKDAERLHRDQTSPSILSCSELAKKQKRSTLKFTRAQVSMECSTRKLM